jgi:hypothetical protein
VAFRIVSGVLGVALAALALFSLSALFAAEREIHRVHDASTAALVGILAVGYFSQVRSPVRMIAPFQQVVVSIGAVLIALAVGSETDPAIIGGTVAVLVIVVLLHPARGDLVQAGHRMQAVLAVIAALAAIPLVAYALDQADLQRACPPSGDEHCGEVHWATMSALALSLPLVGIVAALRAPGWRITAWSAGSAAVLLGLSSLAYGDHVSAIDAPWAAVAIAGGVGFIAVAEWSARRAGRAPPQGR